MTWSDYFAWPMLAFRPFFGFSVLTNITHWPIPPFEFVRTIIRTPHIILAWLRQPSWFRTLLRHNVGINLNFHILFWHACVHADTIHEVCTVTFLEITQLYKNCLLLIWSKVGYLSRFICRSIQLAQLACSAKSATSSISSAWPYRSRR